LEASSHESILNQEQAAARFGWLQLFLSVVIYLAVYIGIFIFAAILLLPLEVTGTNSQSDGILSWPGYALALQAPAFVVTLFLYKRLRQFIWPILRYAAPLKRPQTYLYIALAGAAMFACDSLIMYFGIENTDQQDVALGFDPGLTSFKLFVLTLAIVVYAPIAEEIIFRGLLFRFFTNKIHIAAGFLLSSILFGIGYSGLVLSASLAGLIFAWLYWRTHSIYAPMLLHFLWNGFSMIEYFI